MCCFYLFMQSGGGSEDLEGENHWVFIRSLHLAEQEIG